MRIRMVLQTRWNGKVLRPGDEAEIETTAARRWIDHGIAEAVAVVSETIEASPVPAEESDTGQLEELTVRELKAIIEQHGIEVPKKALKQDLIDIIIAAGIQMQHEAPVSEAPESTEKKTA